MSAFLFIYLFIYLMKWITPRDLLFPDHLSIRRYAFFFFKNIYLFIWLCHVLVAARGIFRYGMRDLLIAACRIFSCGTRASLVAACELLVAACGI